jgi:hypothetical protein
MSDRSSRSLPWAGVNQLPTRTPRRRTPLTRRIPAPSSGLNNPQPHYVRCPLTDVSVLRTADFPVRDPAVQGPVSAFSSFEISSCSTASWPSPPESAIGAKMVVEMDRVPSQPVEDPPNLVRAGAFSLDRLLSHIDPGTAEESDEFVRLIYDQRHIDLSSDRNSKTGR